MSISKEETQTPYIVRLLAWGGIGGSIGVTLMALLRGDLEDHAILAGQNVHGTAFWAYYGVTSAAILVMAVGLLFRKRWAYAGFLIFYSWDVFVAVTNMLLTTDSTLLESGWKVGRPMSHFYFNQAGRVVFGGAVMFWLSRAKDWFPLRKDA